MKDFARVAQLSAEEAFRLLLQKHHHDEQTVWARFETELTKRTAEIEQRHRDELQTLGGRLKEFESAARVADERKALDVQRVRAEMETKLRSEESQREDLNRRVEDYFREITQLRERNLELETEMAKVAHVGKLEEVSFAARLGHGRAFASVRSSPGTAISSSHTAIRVVRPWSPEC